MDKYIIKIEKSGIYADVQVWKKKWSSSMMTNTLFFIDGRKILSLNFFINHWVNKVIFNDLFVLKNIEVVRREYGNSTVTSASIE